MAGFNENTRVKFPALMHLTRIGYTYHALKELDLDPETNIANDIFASQIRKFNPRLTEESISLLLGDIRNKLNNEDLRVNQNKKRFHLAIFRYYNYFCSIKKRCYGYTKSFRQANFSS